MCGIVGYTGNKTAKQVLIRCLEKLEYRGYDSCGIAVANAKLEVFKDTLRVKALGKVLPDIKGTTGIGHTRWATHGEPSQRNAHPHLDCHGRIAVVHNGIISNYQRLRQQLIAEGHIFTSETDTEVISHLVEKFYTDNLEQAVSTALREVKGSYAVLVLAEGQDKIIAAKKDSPLIIGLGDRENFIASDVPAVLDYTNQVLYLEDGDLCIINSQGVKITRDGKEVQREKHRVDWDAADAQRGGYEHFMLKEINEQPKLIRDILGEYLSMEEPLARLESLDGGTRNLMILACGTSYHAALVAKYAIPELTGINLSTDTAGEFNYRSVPPNIEVIAITQSGETADTVKAMKKLKEAGAPLVVITNVVGSSASRIADQVIYTHAGPEISVAATKTFTTQLLALYWLALFHSRIDLRRLSQLLVKLRQLPSQLEQVLGNDVAIRECAEYLSGYENVFFISRGINLATAMEGALKLKEVSYIHAEGYSAAELKHGPFALLSRQTPVVAIITKDNTREAMLSNIKEVKARSAPLVVIAENSDSASAEIADRFIAVPETDPLFSPLINTIVMQLLAYYTAKVRGCPIDFPRNLAKSVTVE